MLRNLIYSFCFHILFIALLFVSTFEFAEKIVLNKITPLTINFINDNIINSLEKTKSKSEDERVKKLKLKEKIDLYNKVKNEKKIQEKNENKNKKLSKNNNYNDEQNEFSYYITPIYVAEDKFDTEEKRKLIENRIKREELRKAIKKRNTIPEIDFEKLNQIQSIKKIVKISQKPLIIAKAKKEKIEKEKNNFNDVEKNKENIKKENNVDINNSNDIEKMALEIDVKNNTIDKKYDGLDKNNIFSEEDIDKLKEINDNKTDTKYMLSLREKRNIQRQIKGCYKMAILRSRKDSKAIVALTVNIEKNGIVNMNGIKVNMIADDFEKGFEIAIDNAKSALIFCSPLRGLPAGKYKTWRQMTFVFDSNNLE